jgi:hypothetical protein
MDFGSRVSEKQAAGAGEGLRTRGISGNGDPLWAFQKAKKIFFKKQAFFNNIKYKANKMILEIHEYIPIDYV